jgi:hypothetical protein
MRLLADIGHPVKDRRRKRRARKPGAGDTSHDAGHRAGPQEGDCDVSSQADEPREAQASGDTAFRADSISPCEMGTRMLVEAAYRISEEVGQDLEAILKTGSSEEKLASLHAKIVKATRNRESAERAYAAIFMALHRP